ncbi:hypothetical protein [Pseudothermotoga thermarum]|uniref:Uncharacterized protein n=1 Tax=Pseudothermotoga thermarum DSM 5069 TaxID=688269 RepID=F7YUI5_9THEM|nr:hypothetical protein [Pseudothermotoga thermarum]AEH51456.1 hypothetical protein Theth_1394 [Pseudothermotoga thermarum DSM 5069]
MNRSNSRLCKKLIATTTIIIFLFIVTSPTRLMAQGEDEGILTVSLEAKRISGGSVSDAIEKAIVPEFCARLIWGFDVEIWDSSQQKLIKSETVPAVYVPAKDYYGYEMISPQSFTISQLVAGQTYHVRVFPLCVYVSPNLVDKYGRKYTYGIVGSHIYFRYMDSTEWQPVRELPQGYDISNPGYFLCHVIYWEGDIQATKRGKGAGSIHGTAW